MSKKYKAIRGMEDLYDPQVLKVWRFVEETARKIFTQAGFQEIRTPIVEMAELFERTVGETTEIVEKEMYSFTDKSENRLALRPEGTASVVRAFIEHFTNHNILEGRFFYLGPMFRYERPQKGRYRQFHQIGAELFGTDHPLADAETIGLLHQLFTQLKLENLEVHLNSLGSRGDRKKYLAALLEFLHGVKDSLCEDCQRRMERNPLRVLDCKKESCQEATAGAPQILEYLNEDSRKHFEQVEAGLKTLGVPFQVNPRMVRGLDYYEMTVFEFLSGELGAQNTVAAGGRYNDLVSDLGGPKVPAIGFALGMERLQSLLSPDKIPASEPVRLYLLGLDETSEQFLFGQLAPLRESGAVVQLDLGSKSLKAKMKRAARWNAQWVVIQGEAERGRGVVVLRDMASSQQEEIPESDLIRHLKTEIITS